MKKTILLLAAIICSIVLGAKEPKRPESYNYQRGVELLQEGEYDQAIDCLEKEITQDPKNGYAYAWLASAYACKEERGTALHLLTKAQEYIPKADKYYHAWTYSVMYVLYLEMKDTTQALECINAAIKIQPKEEDWYESRGTLYRDLKRWTESDADFEQYISLTPGLIRGYLQLAENLYLQQRYAEALTRYQYAHRLAERPFTYSGMARCEVKLNKYEDAVSHIVSALEEESYESTAMQLLSDCHDEEFLELLQAKLTVQLLKNPNAVDWHLYMAIYNRANHRYEEAIREVNKIRTISPDPYFDNMMSELYILYGDYPKALEYINQAIEGDSTDYDYIDTRAFIYSELGDTAAMFSDCATYIEHQPDANRGYAVRAGVYFFYDQYAKAISDYDLALAIRPNDYWSRYLRARCLYCTGDTAKANREYRRICNEEADIESRMFAMASLGRKEEAMHLADSLIKTDTETYRYNAICVYALLGETERALQELEQELQAHYVVFTHLVQDPDLRCLHGERFDELVNTYRTRCQERAARFRQEQGEPTEEARVVEIPFTAANGVTKVDCTINGLPLNFVFDTGASDVTISQTEANFMLKNGYLSAKDVVGKQRYQTADGNISVGTVIMLEHINFGGLELTGVQASVVANQKAPLLLGQTVLKRLGKIEIDNEKRIIRITTK